MVINVLKCKGFFSFDQAPFHSFFNDTFPLFPYSNSGFCVNRENLNILCVYAEAVFLPCFICYRIKIIIKANYIQWNDISRNISVSAPQRTKQEYEYSILLVKHYWISWGLFTFHHQPWSVCGHPVPASPFELIARNGCRNCKQTIWRGKER